MDPLLTPAHAHSCKHTLSDPGGARGRPLARTGAMFAHGARVELAA